MNVNWKKIWQHTLLFVLFGIGFIAFMIIAGDDDPNNPLPLSEWFTIKLGAAVVIAACVCIGKYLNKKGLFSEIDFEDDENI